MRQCYTPPMQDQTARPDRSPPPPGALEFRQVGPSWLHVEHEERDHSTVVTVTSEEWQAALRAQLTTAMARQLRDWLIGHYPLHGWADPRV